MTPYEIDILLHYYTRTTDHPDYHNPPPIWESTIQMFWREGLLRHNTHAGMARVYELTERGIVYVREGLCCVPLPTWAVRFDWKRCPLDATVEPLAPDQIAEMNRSIFDK